eukprot:TRINITY_DN14868_c0_g1_i1.p1 TRINITY_DN14868_c0_g1~~TRINITY_DN14868_c0_g1_i1.p1  ORF type:complete len:618 (-),score=47.67 TRINITY_DN14868_c0_g1_i1:139-1992(-)
MCFWLSCLLVIAAHSSTHASRAGVRDSRTGAGSNSSVVCERKTKSWCLFTKCDVGLYADCRRGRCMCSHGYCTNSKGMCALPETTWNVQLVRNGFPAELPGGRKIVTAFCFSGGGTRAATGVIGIMRALESLGLIEKIDVLSGVSGPTKVLIPYVFADESNFLIEESIWGRKVAPANMHYDEVTKHIPHIARAFAKFYGGDADIPKRFLRMVGHITSGGSLNAHKISNFWRDLMRIAYLTPWGLGSLKTFLASSPSHEAAIKRANPSLRNMKFHTPRPSVPLLLIGTAILGQRGPNHKDAVPFDITAGFVGSPALIDTSSDLDFSVAAENANAHQIVGGGYIEAFAFGGKAPTDLSGSVPSPPRPFTLAEALSMTSYADFLPLENVFKFRPTFAYWPFTDNTSDAEWMFGDGGFSDDSAFLQAARRGAVRIGSALFPPGVENQVNEDFCSIWASIQDGHYTKEQVDAYKCYKETNCVTPGFGAMFGYPFDDGVWHMKHNQIFPREKLFEIGCEFQKLKESGKPSVVRFKQELLPNAFWGITGGYEVDVVLAYQAKSTKFEELLPAETRKLVTPDFPADIKTRFALQPWQINLFSGLMHYSVMENRELYEDLFNIGAS